MAKTAWLFCLCMLLLPGLTARAQTYSLTAEPSADVLTLTFPGKAPVPATLRTGPRQVEMLFPTGTRLAPAPANPGRGRHIMGLGVADNVLAVHVAQEAFGFVASPGGDNTLRLQVFYDPAGARWTPDGPTGSQDKANQPQTSQQPGANPPPAGQGASGSPQAARPASGPSAQAPSTQPANPQAQAASRTDTSRTATGQTSPEQAPAPQAPAGQTAGTATSPDRQPGSNVVRQRVDFSATQPETGQPSPGSAPTSDPQSPGQASQSPARGQGAERVSGPARELLAPGAQPADQGTENQSTTGPGPMAQRLRQSQAQAPARGPVQSQVQGPVQAQGPSTLQAQARQTSGQAPRPDQPQSRVQTPAQAQPPAQSPSNASQSGTSPPQGGQAQSESPANGSGPAASQSASARPLQPSETARPSGPVISGKIQLGPPPGEGQAPAAQAQAVQPAGRAVTGQVAPGQAPSGQTGPGKTSPGQAPSTQAPSGQAPASQPGQPAAVAGGVTRAAGQTQPPPVTGKVQASTQPSADSGGSGQPSSALGSTPSAPQNKAQAGSPVKGAVDGGKPAPDASPPFAPQGQADAGAKPMEATRPQGQGQGPAGQEKTAQGVETQGQKAQPAAKPRAAGVSGAVNLTPEQTPSPAPQDAKAPASQSGAGVVSGKVQTGPAAAGPGTKASPAAPPAGATTPPPPQTPDEQARGATPQAASPEPGSSIELGAQAKKPPQQKPEAFTLPAPGQEPAASDALDIKAFLIEGEQAAVRGDFDKAESIFRTILANQQVSPFMRESALYDLADALFAKNRERITDFYELIDSAYQEALNYNTTSRNIPRALINLGYLNLRMGNLPEARAYFSLLKNKYPLDENVPLTDVYWGQYYLGQSKKTDQRDNLNKAAQSFRGVLQNAPESKYAKDSALGLATTLLDLQQYAEAAKVLDYVDKRWPNYYVENPSLRRVTADVAYKLGDYEKAKDQYLWFMNLVPEDETMDIVLARLGDVYARLDKRAVARQFYEMAIKRHPGSEGALMSLMRLAEQGVHDSPTTQEMFKAFASPQDVRPDQIYEMLVRDYPKSSIAPLALLKLAMWRLYKQEYPETLDRVQQFTTQYAGDDLEKQAVEVGGQAYLKMLPTLMDDSNYKRVVELWNKYPFLAKNPNLLPSRDRLALALSQYYTGRPREALEGALPFLDQGPTEDAQKALALALTIYRENQDWQAVLDALQKVSGWKLAENPRRVLQFAQAMALEHTGDTAKSRLLWGRLAMDQQLDPAKRAYAMYYQARTAMDRGDNEKAALWGQEARTLFEEAAKDTGKAQDALLLVIEAMQAGARFQEALNLCQEYAKTVPQSSPQSAANSFRMAKLYAAMGDRENWRKTLENMRDSLGDSLYAKMAASELATSNLEERAGRLNPPPK